ncbi:MAG: cbb3-type cytochrome oxidase assembly protein CcoS [Cyclobacteriaceae bacterium]
MLIIVGLILISVLVAGFFLGAFIWATKTGQFEDTYGPSVRILFDDEKKVDKKSSPAAQE